ncbi:hypothetical protein FAP94_12335 [Morganella morganii]|nr:hypothetical protein [Morganella morganii]
MSKLNQSSSSLPNSANSVFEKVGLNEQILKEAIGAGLSQYLSASELAPLNAGGSMASFKIIETLRGQLLNNKTGWSILNLKGQCLTINGSAQITLVATSGDKDTGLREGQPCTKNGKGCETKNQIRRNIGQTFNLFEHDLFEEQQLSDGFGFMQEASKIDDHELWVLLYFFDNSKKEVRYELSLPIGFKDVGVHGKVKVSEWGDRIYFRPVPFETTLAIDEPVNFNDEVEFTVTSKE